MTHSRHWGTLPSCYLVHWVNVIWVNYNSNCTDLFQGLVVFLSYSHLNCLQNVHKTIPRPHLDYSKCPEWLFKGAHPEVSDESSKNSMICLRIVWALAKSEQIPGLSPIKFDSVGLNEGTLKVSWLMCSLDNDNVFGPHFKKYWQKCQQKNH